MGEISTEMVTGLAFVFFEAENVLRELRGVQHTYCVTSCFYLSHMTLVHHCSFSSFPSANKDGGDVPLSCFPSTLLRELLSIKNKMQNAMNTRSKCSKQVIKITVENISAYTWYWMIRDVPEHIIVGGNSRAVVKRTYMESDELVVQKWRDTQQFLELTFPDHMEFAQRMFGQSVGLGIRALVCCPLKDAEPFQIVEQSHQICAGDVVNIIPFELEPKEQVRRGLWLNFVPTTGLLSITIRFRAVHRVVEMKPFLQLRGIVTDDHIIMNDDEDDDADVCPLHSDTLVFSKKVKSINFRTKNLVLEDRTIVSVTDGVKYIRDLFL